MPSLQLKFTPTCTSLCVDQFIVMYFEIEQSIYLISSLVGPGMSAKCVFPFVRFCGSVALSSVFPPHVPLQMTRLCASVVALVALERLLPRVSSHVQLQFIRNSASVVALVTFERFFSCMLHHHMNFQITSSIA